MKSLHEESAVVRSIEVVLAPSIAGVRAEILHIRDGDESVVRIVVVEKRNLLNNGQSQLIGDE